MSVTRKLVAMRPDRPMMWVTTVTVFDGRTVRFYGERLTDEEALNRAVDLIEAPEF